MSVAPKDLGTFITLSRNLSIHTWYLSTVDNWEITDFWRIDKKACVPEPIRKLFFTFKGRSGWEVKGT